MKRGLNLIQRFAEQQTICNSLSPFLQKMLMQGSVFFEKFLSIYEGAVLTLDFG